MRTTTDPDLASGPVRPRRRLVTRLVRAYGVATLVVVVLWMVVGDPWWLQPFNISTFWWALPGPVLALALLPRRRDLAVWLLVPAFVWVWSYGSLFLPRSIADVEGPRLRLVSYNVFVQTEDSDHVLDLVAREQPDVLLTQEVLPWRAEQLGKDLVDVLPHSWASGEAGLAGVAVFSRHPIVEMHRVDRPIRNARPTAVVTLDVDGTLIQVVSVHLVSPCPSCGASMVDRIGFEGDLREAEIQAVLDRLDDLPTVIGGDFNSTERSQPYRTLVGAGFDDPQRAAGRGPGFTWPARSTVGAYFRIDWVLTRGMTATAAYVPASDGVSDHRPVVVDLVIGTGASG